jgi:hypothetical protein
MHSSSTQISRNPPVAPGGHDYLLAWSCNTRYFCRYPERIVGCTHACRIGNDRQWL